MTVAALAILVAMLVVMTGAWLCQRITGNGGWVDVFWTYGTGACCAIAALIPIASGAEGWWRHALVAGLVALWSLRLGTYVALRVARGPEDVRYASLRRSWGDRFQRRMLGLVVVQAPVSALLGMAVLYAAREPTPWFRVTDAVGVAILLTAIIGEAVADGQMKRFKADRTNHGRVCDHGLWAWSRHPNYFFEALTWVAYPIIGFSFDRPATWLAWIAPVLMFLVVRFGTGMPALEAAMLQSKGDAYRRYQQRVSPLLPRPPRS